MVTILIRIGEIFLKSRFVSNQLEKRLITNISKQLHDEGISFSISQQNRHIILNSSESKKTIDILKHTFGIFSFSIVEDFSDFDELFAYCDKKIKKWNKKDTFAVRTSRSNKKYPMKSREVNEIVGEYVYNKGFRANLKNPDKEIFINIGVSDFVYSEKIRGPGGIPLKSKSCFVCLNKKEDVLATWYIMKRGVFPKFHEKSKKKYLNLIKKWSSGRDITFSDGKKKKAIIISETDFEKIKNNFNNEQIQLYPLVGLSKQEINDKIDFISSL